MGPKLEAKTLSFGRPSWHPFAGGVGAPGRRRAFFLEDQVAPPKPPPTKKKYRILVLILYLAAFFFGEGLPVGGNLGLQKIALRRPWAPRPLPDGGQLEPPKLNFFGSNLGPILGGSWRRLDAQERFF